MEHPPNPNPPGLGLKILRLLAVILAAAVIIYGIGLEIWVQVR